VHIRLSRGQLLRRLLHSHGIDLKTRELLTFAMLISLGGSEPQVKAM